MQRVTLSPLCKLSCKPHATFEPGQKGLREPKATLNPRVLEPRATIVPKCMYVFDIISWLVRLPTFEPSVLEPRVTIVQSVQGDPKKMHDSVL